VDLVPRQYDGKEFSVDCRSGVRKSRKASALLLHYFLPFSDLKCEGEQFESVLYFYVKYIKYKTIHAYLSWQVVIWSCSLGDSHSW